jgi:N-acetylmuramic acid 6-phosphate etherase
MLEHSEQLHGPVFLGIEGGGTRTVAVAANLRMQCLQRLEAGPANLRLLSDAQLVRHLRGLASALPRPAALTIGLAGARAESDRQRIRDAAGKVWPSVPCRATNDLETALMAAETTRPRGASAREVAQPIAARVLILSGTGSCCYGQARHGQTAKAGGWGHLLGDRGSGYEIGLRALQAVIAQLDHTGNWPRLGTRLLRSLQLNEPEQLIGWAQAAGKTEMAALAVEVFAAASRGDRLARELLAAAADSLARDAVACARRLARQDAAVQFVLAGGVLLKQPAFSAQVAVRLRQLWPGARVTPLRRESVWGAVELARQWFDSTTPQGSAPGSKRRRSAQSVSVEPQPRLTQTLLASPTEQRNPRSMNLDKMPLGAAIGLMLREDARIPAALAKERPLIERLIRLVVRAFRRGGRLFYVGAGTSGRLGVLDASECPPTFQTDPEMVQGIMAGGQQALWSSIEGAEDEPASGAAAVTFRGVTRRDVVVGIAASGRTPFVWGALREARRRGAATAMLCFNPNAPIPADARPTVLIAPSVGPEILTGSTRLKAGTATKLVLNIITTLAMVQLGKVVSNLMVDVKASNEKLRDRATRITQALTSADYAAARAALEGTGWKIKRACARVGS